MIFTLTLMKLYLKGLPLFCIGCLITIFSLAQNKSDSSVNRQHCNVRISLLTCSPGEDLYTTFGHTAIRVIDSAHNSDQVYNYGTFDFSDPTGGEQLRYFLSIDDFRDFMQEYEYYQRSVKEQLLNLNCEEKDRLMVALEKNAMGENKFYRYDFLFDNCSTRPYEMIRSNLGGGLQIPNVLPSAKTSFRNLIHFYLDQNHMYWSELGIDVLLGKTIDRKMINSEAMFLPEYLMKGMDDAEVGGKKLVSSTKTLFEPTENKISESSWFTPLLFFIVLFAIVFLTAMINRPWAIKLSSIFDFIIFFFVGALGFVILMMWFFTDHSECRNNLNILWAFPLHLPAAFFVSGKKHWIRPYWIFAGVLSLIVLLFWFTLPQQFNVALIPIVLLLTWRSWTIFKKSL